MNREISRPSSDRAREGDRLRDPDRGPRGRPARRLQEDAGRRRVRAGRDRPRDGRDARVPARAARGRGAAHAARSEEHDHPRGRGRRGYEPPPPDIDWAAYDEADIQPVDVTSDNFGRIAAQTAKQVILQRIREAEREMMYEEYVNRVGDVVDRDHPAVRLAVHPGQPRPRRGAPARERAGPQRALRPRGPHQGGDHRSASCTKGPRHREPPPGPARARAVQARGSRDEEGLVEIRGAAREPGGALQDQRGLERERHGFPVGPCVGPGTRVCAWSSASCAGKRSTWIAFKREQPLREAL